MTLIGTMLGWHTMLGVAVILSGISLIRKYALPSRWHMPWHSTIGDLLFAAVLHQLFWRMEWAAFNLFCSTIFPDSIDMNVALATLLL